MKPSALLFKAARLIDEKGWNQGAYVGPGGSLCVIGALNIAAGYEFDEDSAEFDFGISKLIETEGYVEAKQALRAHVGKTFLPDWNDAESTTKTQVTNALRETARKLKAEDAAK